MQIFTDRLGRYYFVLLSLFIQMNWLASWEAFEIHRTILLPKLTN